jgi:hypothetical protein
VWKHAEESRPGNQV